MPFVHPCSFDTAAFLVALASANRGVLDPRYKMRAPGSLGLLGVAASILEVARSERREELSPVGLNYVSQMQPGGPCTQYCILHWCIQLTSLRIIITSQRESIGR